MMTKVELLNILYAERSRVEMQCSQPGWTIWAIVAALATICWKAWKLAEQCENWKYVILVFNLLYLLALIFELGKFSYQSWAQTPLWHKGDVRNGIHSFSTMILGAGFITAQLVIIPQTFHPVLYWFAFAGTIIFILMANLAFVATIIGYRTSNFGWWNMLLTIPFAPTIVLLILFLFSLGYEPYLLRLGVLLFAIFYLFTLLPIGEKKKFVQIDKLITQVLYDFEKVDENAVLRKLELQVIGVRYGRYLSEKKLAEYYEAIDGLINNATKLSECIKQGENEQIQEYLQEGERLFWKVSALVEVMSREIKDVYSKDNADSSVLPLISANQLGVEASFFWTKINTIKLEKPLNIEERINQAYDETIGKPETQAIINDKGLWDVDRYRMFNENGR